VDLVTQEYHPLAKIAKDVSAGVVLVTALGAAVAGVLLFLPKIWIWLHL
jgi:diacylglycerol kinase